MRLIVYANGSAVNATLWSYFLILRLSRTLGSDYPQYTLEQHVRALDRLSLDESEKAKIRLPRAQ
jgi:hypothetical protein